MGAGDGKTSGSGSISPFGPPSGQAGAGSASGGANMVKDPMPEAEGGANLVKEQTLEKGGGADMAKNTASPQKSGSFRDPSSVPAGGAYPFGKGGAQPAPSRTSPSSGYYPGSAPAGSGGPNRKPFKLTGNK